MLDFNNSTTWCLQEAGRQQAKDILAIGQDAIHETLEDWFDDLEMQGEYEGLVHYLSNMFFAQN